MALPKTIVVLFIAIVCLRSKMVALSAENSEAEQAIKHFLTKCGYDPFGYKVNVVLTGIFEKHKIGNQDVHKNTYVKTEFGAANNAQIRQNITTASKTYTIQEKDEITISLMAGVTVKSGAKLNFPGTVGGASIELGGSYSNKNTHSKHATYNVTRTIPSQTVTVEPKSKSKVTYSIEEEQKHENYLADFEIDSSSTYDDNLPLYDRLNCRSRSNGIIENSSKVYKTTSIELVKHNDKFILKNFPIKRTATCHTLHVTFERFEQI